MRASAKMALGQVRGRAVGRSNMSGFDGSPARKRGGLEPHAYDETRGRRACCRRRYSEHLRLPGRSRALDPARANLASINGQINSTSGPDNLLHMTDESATFEPCHHRMLIRVKWRSPEPPRHAAHASAVIKQAQSAILAVGSHGRSQPASPARRQGAARSAHVMWAAIGLLMKQKCRILRHGRAT